MKQTTLRVILFLVLNFLALAIGGLFTNAGVSSDWYQSLSKAPWSPPGWVFGFAWTLIMICYAVYMAFLVGLVNRKNLVIIFSLQWILNVLWNPVFFYFQKIELGLFVISALTALIIYFFLRFYYVLKVKSLLILPYLIWLVIATSLNAYIYLYN